MFPSPHKGGDFLWTIRSASVDLYGGTFGTYTEVTFGLIGKYPLDLYGSR